jgi:hypothetical protein
LVNWRSNIQILDLEPDDRLELTCRKCGIFRWLTGAELLARKGKERLTLGEVEKRARCRQRGCGGTMRLAMPAPEDTAGFVGGIA